jgi:hypothetical protein
MDVATAEPTSTASIARAVRAFRRANERPTILANTMRPPLRWNWHCGRRAGPVAKKCFGQGRPLRRGFWVPAPVCPGTLVIQLSPFHDGPAREIDYQISYIYIKERTIMTNK